MNPSRVDTPISKQTLLRTFVAMACFAAIVPAHSFDIDGVHFDDQVKVASTQLKLNGAGIRFAAGGFVRAYATALYSPNKFTRDTDLRNVQGPKRIQLVMMREVNANEFGRAMMKALHANLKTDEQIRYVDGIIRIGGIFGVVPQMKKGETISIDSIPGTGVVIYVSGKRVGEAIRDETFFDAMAQIWLGPNPVDAQLKLALLGQAPQKDDNERLARY